MGKGKKNKKGVSDVIATVLLIAIVMVVGAMVWIMVNNFVKEKTGDTKSCLGLFEKVNIDSRSTCYYSDSKELQFSLSIGDIDVDEMLIGVSGGGTGVSFKIKKEVSAVDNVVMYPSRNALTVKLPGKNAGLTYLLNTTKAGLTESPDLIEVSPVIEGSQCEISDSLDQIDDCAELAP